MLDKFRKRITDLEPSTTKEEEEVKIPIVGAYNWFQFHQPVIDKERNAYDSFFWFKSAKLPFSNEKEEESTNKPEESSEK